MGIFSSIKDKVFSGNEGTAKNEPAKPTVPSGAGAAVMAAAKAAAAKAAEAAAAKAEPVDVEAILEAKLKEKGQKLNWRTSIVDLLKLLDLDSSMAARKELAAELKYSGKDPDGSAEKNIWLHKEVMRTLAENGGKVPADLLK